MSIKRIILLIITIAIFVVIFCFSNQDAIKSEGNSRKIAEFVVDRIENIKNEKYEGIEREKCIAKADHIVRKCAHFFVYTVAGISLMIFLSTFEFKEQYIKILIVILVGFFYAISDEIHQTFVPGRTAFFSDVLIDTGGIIFGGIVVIILKKIFKKKIKKV